MARPKNTLAEPTAMPEILPEIAQQMERGQDAATEAQAAAHQLALQIGYDGTLTMGALEDEIRFYQRRTVEACLELGKRLLLLKELTPHGQFEKRVSLLGIEKTKAHRFMKSAAATVKSGNLQLLAGQAQSFAAFWEIVMTDDEVVENILEWDAIDRMSASELRAALRDTKADLQAAGERIDAKNKVIDGLEHEKQLVRRLPPDEALLQTQKEATAQMNDALGCIKGSFRQALIALAEASEGTDGHANEVFAAGLVGQLAHQLALLREEFDLPDVSNARDLQTMAEVAQWAGPDGAAAAPAAEGEPAAAH